MKAYVMPSSPAICIDCSPLLVRSAGVKTYLYHWLNAMGALEPEAISTFLAPGGSNGLHHDGGVWTHPVQIATLLSLNRLPSLFTDLMVPQCDIFHVSNLLRKLPKRRRLSATVHDLTAWVLPECHTPVMVAADKAFADRVLRRADGLIAVSESTKQDAIRILGIPPDKIRIIHLGVPPGYTNVPNESILRVAGTFGLKRPYFLSVGTIEPRKNIDTLLTAWQSLPDDIRNSRELVIAGMPGWHSDSTMKRLNQANADAAGIRYLGYVPERDLPGLTAGAEAFVYPSLYEGFGIPVAQAMAAGCPVITSNLSSLPEITSGAAILVDPRSPSELRSAIQRMVESTELRTALKDRGIAQSARFSWNTAAAEALRYFSEIA